MRPVLRIPRCIRALRDVGATSAEYALIAGLIAVVIITAVALLGGALAARYDDTASQVESATNP